MTPEQRDRLAELRHRAGLPAEGTGYELHDRLVRSLESEAPADLEKSPAQLVGGCLLGLLQFAGQMALLLVGVVALAVICVLVVPEGCRGRPGAGSHGHAPHSDEEWKHPKSRPRPRAR